MCWGVPVQPITRVFGSARGLADLINGAKLYIDRFKGFGLREGQRWDLLAFLGSRTVRTESRTMVNDGSKDVFSVQEVPFGISVDVVTPEVLKKSEHRQSLTAKGKFQHNESLE